MARAAARPLRSSGTPSPAASTFGALFAYISGSSFVLQGIYGLSPQLYSLAFAMNGLGLIAASQVNARLVGRFGPARLLRGALACVVASALALLVVVLDRRPAVWARARADVRHRLEPARSCCPTRPRSRSPTTRRWRARRRRCSASSSSWSARSPRRWSARPGRTARCRWPSSWSTLALGGARGAPVRRPAAAVEARAMTLVTISASYGAGGSRIAPALAERLGVPLLGRPPAPDLDPEVERAASGRAAVARRLARAGVGDARRHGARRAAARLRRGATRSSARSASSPPAARA